MPVLHGPGLYSCRNHPPRVKGDTLPIATRVQTGWTADGRRIMKQRTMNWLPVECGHVDSADDPKCGDCRWRRSKGEDDEE